MKKIVVESDSSERIDLRELVFGVSAILENISNLGDECEISLVELFSERRSNKGTRLQVWDLIVQNIQDANILTRIISNSYIPPVKFDSCAVSDQVCLNSTRRLLGLSSAKPESGIPGGEVDLF